MQLQISSPPPSWSHPSAAYGLLANVCLQHQPVSPRLQMSQSGPQKNVGAQSLSAGLLFFFRLTGETRSRSKQHVPTDRIDSANCQSLEPPCSRQWQWQVGRKNNKTEWGERVWQWQAGSRKQNTVGTAFDNVAESIRSSDRRHAHCTTSSSTTSLAEQTR